MRILHVIPFLWSGAGRVLTDLCVSQRESHEVTIVTSGKSKGLTDWPVYRRRLARCGVGHQRIDFFDRDPAVFWSGVGKLSRFVLGWRPDVIHCHSGVPACAVAAVRDTASTDFRFISQLHSWGNNRPAWMDAMDLWGFHRSDSVVANAAAYRRILIGSGIAQSRVFEIPWGVTPEATQLFQPVRRRSGCIGFVGRIEPRKGQLELVRAFDLLHRRNKELRLELIGPVADAAYAQEIETTIRSRNLSGNVWLGGQVRDVYRRERQWDLFVSLSSDEGQGMAILEAMALGVPVLARNCPGVQDYLQDGENAIALKPGARNVAEAIALALDHPEETRKLAVRARKMVDAQYSWDRTVLGMDRLYGNGKTRRLAAS